MTPEDLGRTLPNGFHDAQVTSLCIDFAQREVAIKINVWVGDCSSRSLDVREAYRPGLLTLSGLLYCSIEPPDPRYPYRDGGAITIDAGTVESLVVTPSAKLPGGAPDGAWTHWFFVKEWNAFVYISARAASLTWVDEAACKPSA